jgi:hypothetical protein
MRTTKGVDLWRAEEMKSTYEARWGHKRGAPSKKNPQGNAHSSGNRIERERKRVEADARNAERAKRTIGEQLLILTMKRPGKSAKEKARLRALIGE